jgi:hypothetical protein
MQSRKAVNVIHARDQAYVPNAQGHLNSKFGKNMGVGIMQKKLNLDGSNAQAATHTANI